MEKGSETYSSQVWLFFFFFKLNFGLILLGEKVKLAFLIFGGFE